MLCNTPQPSTPPQEAQDEVVAPAQRDGPSSSPVLIVDDDAAVRRSLRFLLTGHGFSIRATATIDEATRVLAKGNVRVIVTDFDLPGGGQRWIDYLSATQPDAAIIILTGAALDRKSLRALRKRVFAVLAKPVSADELVQIIRRALAGT